MKRQGKRFGGLALQPDRVMWTAVGSNLHDGLTWSPRGF